MCTSRRLQAEEEGPRHVKLRAPTPREGKRERRVRARAKKGRWAGEIFMEIVSSRYEVEGGGWKLGLSAEDIHAS